MMEKRHTKTGDSGRIAREAELLGAARHPGVVELLGIEGDPRTPMLVTRRVEGRALSEVGGLSRAEVAGVTAALASTLAELHQLGVVHGAVAPEHVLLGPGDRPVLCSFGYGGRVGETSPARPPVAAAFVDPGRGDEDPLDPSVDIYGLGAVLRSLLEVSGLSRADQLLQVAHDATGPDVAHRPTASQVAAAISTAVSEARLPGAPDDSSTVDPGDRGSDLETGVSPDIGARTRRTGRAGGDPELGPRRLITGRAAEAGLGAPPRARALETLRGTRALPKGRDRRVSPGRPATSRHRRPIVMAAIGAAAGFVVLVIAGRSLVGSGNEATTPVVESALPTAIPTTLPSVASTETSEAGTGVSMPRPVATTMTTGADAVTTLPTTTNGLAVRPRASSARADCPTVGGSLIADTDGDGCLEALYYAGGILETGTARWSVGADGDQVATGDWNCRGKTVLAVLRPPTGDVFVFDGWAAADHDLVAPAVTRVEGGFALRSAQLGDGGCQGLVIDRRDGAPVMVPIGTGE